jgi:ankyrin repeat protein
VDEGVNPYESDARGRTALHLAIRSGNLHLIKFLIDVEHFDVNQTDKRGTNAITTLLKGDRILKANVKILEYLIKSGGNPNQLYEEKMYQASKKDIIEELKDDE